MAAITETGRFILPSVQTMPGIEHRVCETGRNLIRRPLTDEGRWLLGDFYLNILELMDLPIHVDVNPTVEVEVSTCTDYWDLVQMVPRKFQVAPIMHDYLAALSHVVNAVSCRIDNLQDLTDVNTCPKKYLGHLSALIATKLKNQTYSTIAELRNQIKMAVEMYKIKGTYPVLDIAFYILGLKVGIWDLWTKDYVNFTRYAPHYHSGVVPGFNPESGLRTDDGWHFDENLFLDGNGGFKSPHFDLVIKLERPFYLQGIYQKLFISEYMDALEQILEEYTPVNTVPHVYLELYARCNEDWNVYTIPDSRVKTTITDNWLSATYYFDQGHHLDQGKWADYTFETLIAAANEFRVGNGNIGHTPDHTWTDIQNAIYTGTIKSFQITNEKVIFTMEIPSAVDLSDITELGIYHPMIGMIAVACFPGWDKPQGAIGEILVEVYRKF